MDTRTATLLAAAAALTSSPGLASTPASEAPVPRVSSYAELLQPIPNATERLRAADLDTSNAAEQPQLIETQYYRDHHHHHHHHHSREWYRSHGYWWNGGAWVLRPRRHHHHHHNNNY
ncbi:MAG TPA: hypothetical protein VMT68_03880 [Caulobacteraceae bacterium]|nr:hypothetical protein [Caulobacteraceae bacterium]